MHTGCSIRCTPGVYYGAYRVFNTVHTECLLRCIPGVYYDAYRVPDGPEIFFEKKQKKASMLIDKKVWFGV